AGSRRSPSACASTAKTRAASPSSSKGTPGSSACSIQGSQATPATTSRGGRCATSAGWSRSSPSPRRRRLRSARARSCSSSRRRLRPLLHVLEPIDLRFLGEEGAIGCYVVETDDGPALFDCGPATTLDALRAGLRERGLELTDVRHLLLSHIHLDHAGAAGAL